MTAHPAKRVGEQLLVSTGYNGICLGIQQLSACKQNHSRFFFAVLCRFTDGGGKCKGTFRIAILRGEALHIFRIGFQVGRRGGGQHIGDCDRIALVVQCGNALADRHQHIGAASCQGTGGIAGLDFRYQVKRISGDIVTAVTVQYDTLVDGDTIFGENGIPSMVTVPSVEAMYPVMIFMVVDFPAPFGPRKP